MEKTIKEELITKNIDVEDLQCPFISRYNATLEELASGGMNLIAFGREDDHHCLDAQRVSKVYGRKCVTVEKAEDIDHIDFVKIIMGMCRICDGNTSYGMM